MSFLVSTHLKAQQDSSWDQSIQDVRIEIPGYTLEKIDKILDKGFSVYYWTHNKTGAKVVFIKNQDQDRLFSIGFKTFPWDDTGVFHILEHSVLQGSKKYPIIGLFGELGKSNITTFRNAFTYRDKTIYPVASNNEASFINLVDAYLDSVFNPMVKENPYIFYQEGVRRDVVDGKLKYNGVVFNEMSGTFTPGRVMSNNFYRVLYKNSFWANVSGGDPLYIPDLSYEKLIETYDRFYHPSNALMFFYGDVDILERLRYIDENYLSKYEREDEIVTPRVVPVNPGEDIDVQKYPAGATKSEEVDSYLSVNYILDNPSLLDRLLISTLLTALFDDEASSVREELLSSGLFKSMNSSCDHLATSYIASIDFSGTDSKDGWEIVQKIYTELDKVADKGIDPKLIRSVLISKKFKQKTIPSGNLGQKLYMESVYSGWIYSDNPLFELNKSQNLDRLLSYSDEKLVDSIKEVVKKYLLRSSPTIRYNVVTVPDTQFQKRVHEEIQEKARLELEGMSETKINQLQKLSKDFSKFSLGINTESDIKKLPSIKVDDLRTTALKDASSLPQVVAGKRGSFLTYDTVYDELSHVSLYFDVSTFTEEELQYLTVMSYLFGRVSTRNLNLKDLNIKLNISGTMRLSFVPIYTKDKRNLFTFNVDINFLPENQKDMLTVAHEILYSTRFDEVDKIVQVIEEYIDDGEDTMANSPINAALSLSNSFYSQYANFLYLTGGPTILSFLKDVVKKIKEEPGFSITEKLEQIRQKIIDTATVSVGIASRKDNIDGIITDVEDIFTGINPTESSFKEGYYKLGLAKNIGLISQQNVSYLVNSSVLDISEDGPLSHHLQGSLIQAYLSRNYLYKNIRVQGGAYGASMLLYPDGLISVYTIRDPNVRHSLDTVLNIPSFLEQLSVSDRDDLQTKIVVTSNLFSPVTPFGAAKLAFTRFFQGVSDKQAKERIDIILGTNLGTKLKECVSLFTNTVSLGTSVIVGNEKNLKELQEDGVIEEIKTGD